MGLKSGRILTTDPSPVLTFKFTFNCFDVRPLIRFLSDDRLKVICHEVLVLEFIYEWNLERSCLCCR